MMEDKNMLKAKLLKQLEELEKEEEVPAADIDEKLKGIVEGNIAIISNQRKLLIGEIVIIALVIIWIVLLFQL